MNPMVASLAPGVKPVGEDNVSTSRGHGVDLGNCTASDLSSSRGALRSNADADYGDDVIQRAGNCLLAMVSILLLAACTSLSASGYNESRGYDNATLKMVFSLDSGKCLNRFTYGSKLAPSRPEVVPCDSPAARVRDDGFHANAPGCLRIDYESLTQNDRAYYCLKYLVRLGYCYPALTPPNGAPVVLLYAPSACDESLPLPQVAGDLVAEVGADPPAKEWARYVVTEIQSPAKGKHCASVSVDLEPPEEIEGPGIPPATSQLVCLAPK
jgi:hypothetical protein